MLEVTKVSKLTDHDYLSKHILIPAINLGRERGYINTTESSFLKIGVECGYFTSSDIDNGFKEITARQRTALIAKMRKSGFIRPLKEGGRTYVIWFKNNYLMRSLIQILQDENFIPKID